MTRVLIYCRPAIWYGVLAVAVGIGDPAMAATKMRGFPVRLEGTVDTAPPLAVDMDGDGKLELIVATRHQIHVLEADGSPVEGFPVILPRGAELATPMAIGTLGPAGQPTILFGTADGGLAAIESSGAMRTGFPLKLGANLAGAPSLGDLDGDGRPEILFGTKDGRLHVVSGDGKPVRGYPARVGTPVSTAVTLGRFDPKGDKMLLFGDAKGRLHAWIGPGKEAAGFPYSASFAVAAQPVLGDLDDDGRFEVVFGSKDYKIHVVEPDGSAAPGFPVTTGYRIYSSCALADIDGDGVVDLLAASGDGKLYAFGAGGRRLPGFAVKIGGRLRSAPVVADMDLDGRMEIAVGSDRNRLVVLRSNGKNYPGFPARMRSKVEVAPLLADLNGDGLSEIVAVSKDGTLEAFRMLRKGRGVSAIVWPTEGRDAARSGIVHPNPPRYVSLAISPKEPATTDQLELGYRFFDMDGDPEPAGLISWYRNGKPVENLRGVRKVPAGRTRKHERWHFSVQAGPGQRVFSIKPVGIRNTPPQAPGITLQPQPARTGDDLVMKVVEESKDVDGDEIRYRITWLKDRRPRKGLNRSRVAARLTAKGQRWTVVVTPSDGEVNGQPARASLVVANTAPSASRVRLVPARPAVTRPVRVEVKKPGRDPDGDPVSYLYRWLADGKELNLPETGEVLPDGMVAKHGKLRVEVTSFDGLERGGSADVTVEVVNTPPAAPQVRIEPASPGTGDDLAVEVIRPAEDSDRDPVSYRFAWRRKGRPYRGEHASASRLPSSETRRGERWSVVVIPNDGESDGKSARAEAVIGNTPPDPPVLVQVDPRPPTDQDLRIRVVEPPRDPDGDEVWTDVVWSLDGRELGKGKDLWQLPADRTRKHGRYLAHAVPSDGTDAGRPVRLWFEVRNTPPPVCAVAIEPKKPGTGQELAARTTRRQADADHDEVEMRYRWYRDGEPVEPGAKPHLVDGKLVKRGQRWTVVAVPFDGEQEGSSCEASTTIVNRAPGPPVIGLVPERPTATDSLVLKIIRPAKDVDGDPIRLQRSWTKDGRPFAAGDGEGPIPEGALHKGQRWVVTVKASDGELTSAAPVRAEVRIVNSPPGRPSVEIRPEKPLSSDDLRCRLAAATGDPDGDPVEHEYEWFLRGKPVHKGAALPAGRTRKGQRWLCRVIASDGELSGPEATAEVEVGNAAPTAPRVRIEPADPRADQVLRCVIDEPAADPDGDEVRYRFQWSKDGVVQKFAAETDRVPIRLTRPNDFWQCKASAFDGHLQSPPSESREVLVGAGE